MVVVLTAAEVAEMRLAVLLVALAIAVAEMTGRGRGWRLVTGALRGCWFVVKYFAVAVVVMPFAALACVVIAVWGMWGLVMLAWRLVTGAEPFPKAE
jgi:hypothetical protein